MPAFAHFLRKADGGIGHISCTDAVVHRETVFTQTVSATVASTLSCCTVCDFILPVGRPTIVVETTITGGEEYKPNVASFSFFQ